MQLGFYFDQQRCTGCYTCVVACKQWNQVPPGPASWRRVLTLEESKFPHVWLAHLSLACCHCTNPACIPACPTSAIRKREKDGIVVVEQSQCMPACRSCLHACPYEAPQFRNENSRMEKCDFCLDRIDKGKKPLCVISCPLRALDSGPVQELERTYGYIKSAPGSPSPAQTQPSILFRPKAGPRP